jgi:hypothetical protein
MWERFAEPHSQLITCSQAFPTNPIFRVNNDLVRSDLTNLVENDYLYPTWIVGCCEQQASLAKLWQADVLYPLPPWTSCHVSTHWTWSQASLYIFIKVYSILLPILVQRRHVIAVTWWSVNCRKIDKWGMAYYELYLGFNYQIWMLESFDLNGQALGSWDNKTVPNYSALQ